MNNVLEFIRSDDFRDVRKYIYNVSMVVIPALAAFGYIKAESAPVFAAILTVALGFTAPAVARVALTPKSEPAVVVGDPMAEPE